MVDLAHRERAVKGSSLLTRKTGLSRKQLAVVLFLLGEAASAGFISGYGWAKLSEPKPTQQPVHSEAAKELAREMIKDLQ